MQALLSLANAGLAYDSDPDTGLLRVAANEQALRVGGIDYRYTVGGLILPASAVIVNSDNSDYRWILGVPYPWLFGSAPTGCVFAYGQACTTALYPTLRGQLIASGSPYGNNGTDPLFPNMQGVVVAGRSNMSGVDRGNLPGGTVLGAGSPANFGEASHTLTAAELPQITPSGTVSTPTIAVNDNVFGGETVALGADVAVLTGAGTSSRGITAASSALTFTGNAFGANGSHNNVQPTIVLNWIMRAY